MAKFVIHRDNNDELRQAVNLDAVAMVVVNSNQFLVRLIGSNENDSLPTEFGEAIVAAIEAEQNGK